MIVMSGKIVREEAHPMLVASGRTMLIGQCQGGSVKHVVFEDLAMAIVDDIRKRLMIYLGVRHFDLVATHNFNPHEHLAFNWIDSSHHRCP